MTTADETARDLTTREIVDELIRRHKSGVTTAAEGTVTVERANCRQSRIRMGQPSSINGTRVALLSAVRCAARLSDSPTGTRMVDIRSRSRWKLGSMACQKIAPKRPRSWRPTGHLIDLAQAATQAALLLAEARGWLDEGSAGR
ncbi:hypothetical protein [Mycobacterium conspicuum]|jgi:hypothetical protein|uniref:Uncharacterized protein n=1 Tax=Mycobacterium conspicuum TaxID=44010 RepID=A0A7I7YAI3_9MYCO|nr:hypothetical protein [Mycobacterium conspicuum]BBZ38718.1 hypothetical protein MCNS_17810 [Mycobacterium conspicuum]